MHALIDLCRRLRLLPRRDAIEARLDEELRFHVEQQAGKHASGGAAPEEAAPARRGAGRARNLRERGAHFVADRLPETLGDIYARTMARTSMTLILLAATGGMALPCSGGCRSVAHASDPGNSAHRQRHARLLRCATHTGR